MARRRPEEGGPLDPLPRDPNDPRAPIDPRGPRDPGHPQPPPPPPPPPAGAVPSITSWTHLESRTRQADMSRSLNARVFDPLWMLTRQWQVGEVYGEDVGMPGLAG